MVLQYFMFTYSLRDADSWFHFKFNPIFNLILRCLGSFLAKAGCSLGCYINQHKSQKAKFPGSWHFYITIRAKTIDLVFIVWKDEDDSSSQMISHSIGGVRVLLRQTVGGWKMVKREKWPMMVSERVVEYWY